jgi:signal transduction histidine kinase
MVLHNGFFLLLACAIYFSLIPLVETRLAEARQREMSLILKQFETLEPTAGASELQAYDLRIGSAGEFGLPPEAVGGLKDPPGRYWRRDSRAEHVYKEVKGAPGRYWRLTLPLEFYDTLLGSIKVALFAVLGAAYVGAVLLLELVIMPLYVYQPLRLMLEADDLTRRGERASEQIDPAYIPGDEIGQIMESRNDTVAELRRREDQLGLALERLEETARDLQEKNKLLEAAKRSLEAQDRLVSLGMLSASVAHEMNTPLAVLHGSIEKLMETVQDRGAQGRLERMHRVTERLKRISVGLLDFARVRKEEMGPVAVRPLVEEAWQLVAIDEKASVVHFENLVSERVRVTGNADRLVQVFVNLLRNALLAVPGASGHISVSTSPAVLENGPAVTIAVEDNGPGIPPEVLPEIFEAFVTTRLDARGTGLGLTVAEGIVSQHGGTISAANCASGGARLEVVLPAAREEATI